MGAYGRANEEWNKVEVIKRMVRKEGCTFKAYVVGGEDAQNDFDTQFIIGSMGCVVHAGGTSQYPVPTYLKLNDYPYVPPHNICNLKHLTTVDVKCRGENLLWLGNIPELETLILRKYHQEQLPASWACEYEENLLRVFHYEHHLKTIWIIFGNQDSEKRKLPDCVRTFRFLEELNLRSSANLLELPEWVSELKCLRIIDLRDCHMEDIPLCLIKTGLPFITKGDLQRDISGQRGILLDGVSLDNVDISLFSMPYDEILSFYRTKYGEQFDLDTYNDADIQESSIQNSQSTDGERPESRRNIETNDKSTYEDSKNRWEARKAMTDTVLNVFRIVIIIVMAIMIFLGIVRIANKDLIQLLLNQF